MVSIIAYNHPFDNVFYPAGRAYDGPYFSDRPYSYGFRECPTVRRRYIRRPVNHHPYFNFARLLEALLPEESDEKNEKKTSEAASGEQEPNPQEKSAESSSSENEGFHVKLAVNSYKPEDFKVTLEGRQVKVSGKFTEENEEDGWQVSHVQYLSHSYTLPENVDADKLTTTLSPEGVLSIEAPILPALEKPTEKIIPIELKSTTPAAETDENETDAVVDDEKEENGEEEEAVGTATASDVSEIPTAEDEQAN